MFKNSLDKDHFKYFQINQWLQNVTINSQSIYKYLIIHWHPQYLVDQLTLFRLGEGRYCWKYWFGWYHRYLILRLIILGIPNGKTLIGWFPLLIFIQIFPAITCLQSYEIKGPSSDSSEWPKVHFYIWPQPKTEYLKKFGLWPNTKAKCWFFLNSYPSADLILFLLIYFW
jgi:hypothetical protein